MRSGIDLWISVALVSLILTGIVASRPAEVLSYAIRAHKPLVGSRPASGLPSYGSFPDEVFPSISTPVASSLAPAAAGGAAPALGAPTPVQIAPHSPASSSPPSAALCKLDAPEACLRAVGSPVHRSAVAIGFSSVPPALSAAAGYYTYHAARHAGHARRIWEQGGNSVLFPRLAELPIADLAVDVVALNASSVADEGAQLLTEAVRILAPAGLLVVVGAGPGGLSELGSSPLARAVLEETTLSNAFRRKVGMGPGLPPCRECGSRDRGDVSRGACQPFVAASYQPVTSPARVRTIQAAPSLAAGRLRSLPMENVLRTSPVNHSWAVRTRKAMPGWFASNYVSVRRFQKPEFHNSLMRLVKDGSVKSILDAGAGSCTLDALLRERGLVSRLTQFVAFGAYDCSMLRICAERGTISLDYNWLSPLPFCEDCRFDMVFQAEGMHHLRSKEDVRTTLDHFTKHLACGGILAMDDSLWKGKGWNWQSLSADYLKRKGYERIRKFKGVNQALTARKPAC